MVMDSTSVFVLQRCCEVIIESLFNRDGDEEFRAAYLEQMVETLKAEESSGADLESTKAAILEILRVVKVNRQQRAQDYAAEKEAGSKAGMTGTSQPSDPESAFISVLCDQFADRMAALREDIKQDEVNAQSLPFPVSRAFARCLEGVIRDHVAPAMINKCRIFVNQAERAEPDKRYEFLHKALNERANREVLWDAWRLVWHEATAQQELPPKPKEPEKGSLFSKLTKKSATPSWMEEPMTLDEWKFEISRIKAENKQAKKNWARIITEDDAYQAPVDADNKLLMNLFARTATAMSKQVNGVRQIAEQGGNAVKLFADYQQGKDIDLPLLVACCQRPDLFLDGGLLKGFMRSFSETMRQDRFGLVDRFFPDHM